MTIVYVQRSLCCGQADIVINDELIRNVRNDSYIVANVLNDFQADFCIYWIRCPQKPPRQLQKTTPTLVLIAMVRDNNKLKEDGYAKLRGPFTTAFSVEARPSRNSVSITAPKAGYALWRWYFRAVFTTAKLWCERTKWRITLCSVSYGSRQQ